MYTSPRTIKVQFESPLSHVKSRIDEIHSVIEQSAFIKPMISTAGIRRTLFADSLLNTKKVEQKIRAAVIANRGPSQDLPALPVSSPPAQRSAPSSSWVNVREDAKLTGGLSSAQLEAKKRFEKRKIFHRNCIPEEVPKEQVSPHVIPRQTYVEPIAKSPPRAVLEPPPVTRVEATSPVQVNRHSRAVSPMKQFMSVGISPLKTAPTRVTIPASVEKGIAGLEQLIQDTHQLLQEEGLVDHAEVLPQDLVEEIERDIEALSRKTSKTRTSTKNLQELEMELEELINKKI